MSKSKIGEYKVFSISKKARGSGSPGFHSGSFLKYCLGEKPNKNFGPFFTRACLSGIGSPRFAEMSQAERGELVVDKMFDNMSGSTIKQLEWDLFKDFSTLFEKGVQAVSNRRVIIAPSLPVKIAQKEITNWLGQLKPHMAAFGFVRNRSALDCANYHLGAHNSKIQLLVNIDIQNFFGSVREKDVTDSLLAHGIGDEETRKIINTCMIKLTPHVAVDLLSMFFISLVTESELLEQITKSIMSQPFGVNTTAFSKEFFREYFRAYMRRIMWHAYHQKWLSKDDLENSCKKMLKLGESITLGDKFLPQGAPSSPLLSNLAFKRMDFRLDGLASKHGAAYSRYADDITFTWSERMGKKSINLFIHTVKEIIKNNGFKVNPQKTKVVGTGGQMEVVGYIINSGRPTISKKYCDSLRKEILEIKSRSEKGQITSSIAFNRIEQKIAGKIAFVGSACPDKADKLCELFSKIHVPGITQHRYIHLDNYSSDEEN